MKTSSLSQQIQLGVKKIVYAFDRRNDGGPDRVDLLVDCLECHGSALITISMTSAQFIEWQARARLIQDIFPDINREVREILVTGTTPLEWRALFGIPPGTKPLTIGDCKQMGYSFEPPDDNWPDDTIAPGQVDPEDELDDEPEDTDAGDLASDDDGKHLGDDHPDNFDAAGQSFSDAGPGL